MACIPWALAQEICKARGEAARAGLARGSASKITDVAKKFLGGTNPLGGIGGAEGRRMFPQEVQQNQSFCGMALLCVDHFCVPENEQLVSAISCRNVLPKQAI